MSTRFGRTELPEEQEKALRRAIRLEWLTIASLAVAVTLIYLSMGSSQAMKSAWFEDMLSFIPPISFLLAVRATRRSPTPKHPFGYHRSVGVGHLVAGTALVAMGAFLVFDSASKLLKQEHPPVGLMEIGGITLWSGWLMIAVLGITNIPPVILGRAKLDPAKKLHDRVLYADADMNKADWMTALAGIVGIIGIGFGLWWADSAAALFISAGILHDGVKNVRVAVSALMDARATTYDGEDPHPLVPQIDDRLSALPWVAQAKSRVRDQGHVFHVESFVVPARWATPTIEQLVEAREAIVALDWKVQDAVVIPVEELPANLLPGAAEKHKGHDAG